MQIKSKSENSEKKNKEEKVIKNGKNEYGMQKRKINRKIWMYEKERVKKGNI